MVQRAHTETLQQMQARLDEQTLSASTALSDLRAAHGEQLAHLEAQWAEKLRYQEAESKRTTEEMLAKARLQHEQVRAKAVAASAASEAALAQQLAATRQCVEQLEARSQQLLSQEEQLTAQVSLLETMNRQLQDAALEAERRAEADLAAKDKVRCSDGGRRDPAWRVGKRVPSLI